ncbi:SDR family NAD(P)-dependent oxidoreductase [Aurantimonas endophytica]|uniref:CDP-paratose 2-epimerase n=1 Tax=Aurantimonas endophytica TaxID=1522175 RepID=A0A7W6HGQ9_9HYPH|nr:SDR family NAD(P)-dependent oxidoreductase [Aurantimonas endophytica]MBB4004711.1 CDP-paratose 2-epimerase [Aurantimonas endophytica]MCO6405527.1 SDR family NAD(P)-dependent oxidoreductase [Aurantimonas endophytica]
MTDGPTGQDKSYGFAEWFRPGEYERTQSALDAMERAGARYVRTHLSWAEYHQPEGPAWYDWLIPKIAERFELLPCVHYTPPSLSRTGTSAGPPHRLLDFADFVDHVLTRYGEHFTAVELWNEPNNLLDWDWRLDTDWTLFCEMVGAAAHWAQERGYKTVLGGLSPFDAHWLHLIGERGLLAKMDVVGLHGFPGTWDSENSTWSGWDDLIGHTRAILEQFAPEAEIWITEAGYATWRHDEAKQAESFLTALRAPAERLYWYGWQDVQPDVAVQEGLRFDERHYHMGVVDAAGQPKLLARLLSQGGVAAVRETMALAAPHLRRGAEPIVVTGGAGFIGCNIAESFLAEGRDVVVVDNLSRPGVERNLAWLRDRHRTRVHWQPGDVRDEDSLRDVLQDAGAVFHLAAQVAVTTSLEQPMADFEVNARGTLNVLEAVRRSGRKTPVIFASTNKVYGNLADLAMKEEADRYAPADNDIAAHGVSEARRLDFCTPYGCSKGVADQYVLDYAKSYDLPTAVLRMSCIYGPRQFGTEDQGWVAHFLIRALRDEGLTIYGDGKQVRDILHVADAVAAYRALLANIDTVQGRAFNLGGGPDNAVSLRTVLAVISDLVGGDLAIRYSDTRQGDQTYFVADTRQLTEAVDWRAKIGWQEGLSDLHAWLSSEEGPLEKDQLESLQPLPAPLGRDGRRLWA